MSFQEFEQEVRDKLSVLGLPINCQPQREALHFNHARGVTVDKTVSYYSPLVKRYEDYVNKRNIFFSEKTSE